MTTWDQSYRSPSCDHGDPQVATDDAWNRLVKVTDAGNNTIQANEFDGLGRRIVRVDVAADPDVTYDYYYNEDWQLLEERKDGDADPLAQYIWHPYYVDALAIRYYDADTDGSQVEHYYVHDANFNVTAILEDDGDVLERYQYSPFGRLTYLEPDFDVASTQASTTGNTHFYTGRESDPETGGQLNRRRFYAARLGRWVNRDPIGYIGGINPYLALSGIQYLDSHGKSPIWVADFVAKSFINGVAPIGGFNPDRAGLANPPFWLPLIPDELAGITTAAGRLNILASFASLLEAFNQNPNSDAKDGVYRLYTRTLLKWECCWGGIKLDSASFVL